MTCKDKASYESLLLCMSHGSYTYASPACMCTTAVCVRVFVRVCVCVCVMTYFDISYVCVCHDLS